MTVPHPPLSKSRFTAGWQCPKLLWWKVHEPQAPELQPDIVLQDRFDQGRQVGELARARFPGGVLIDLPHDAAQARVAATREALDGGAPCVFEGTFVADSVLVATDVLVVESDGVRLIEVKSASHQKDDHVVDAAIQVHVLRRSGLEVTAAEIMHLNPEFRHPDTGDLFARTDVTTPVDRLLGEIPATIERQVAALAGPLPEVTIDLHCHEPRACPFLERCWPPDRDHISRLYRVGPKRSCGYMQTGVRRIGDLPPTAKLSPPARRQIRAMQEDRLIVEPTLAAALEPFDCRLGFLDFETINRAVPVWPGMRPWGQAAAQFSYHELTEDGSCTHAEFLAEGPEDARPPLARAMVEATAGAERVVTYTGFEKGRIRALQEAVPELRAELEALEAKLLDLHPVVRDHVYHPDFRGSFSLKYILTPLVPELTYDDLIIVDGLRASVEIARLLFVAGKIRPADRDRTRRDLLDYCERDTWAMVKLLERLRELATAA